MNIGKPLHETVEKPDLVPVPERQPEKQPERQPEPSKKEWVGV